MCILMGNIWALFWNNCLLLQSFGVINAKIDFFEDKMGLSVVFLYNWSVGGYNRVYPIRLKFC